MMDLETVKAAELGRSLRGIGVNLLCRDVSAMARFMSEALGLSVHRLSADFALVRHADQLIQLHADGTYGRHPLHALLPESPPRGTGLQLYLFGIDPDAACTRAPAAGGMVLEPPADKPHGLREATILSPEGYAISPAIALPPGEQPA